MGLLQRVETQSLLVQKRRLINGRIIVPINSPIGKSMNTTGGVQRPTLLCTRLNLLLPIYRLEEFEAALLLSWLFLGLTMSQRPYRLANALAKTSRGFRIASISHPQLVFVTTRLLNDRGTGWSNPWAYRHTRFSLTSGYSHTKTTPARMERRCVMALTTLT